MRIALLLLGLVASWSAVAQSLDYPSVWSCGAESKAFWYCDADEAPAAATPPASAPKPVGVTPPQKRIENKDIKTAEQMRVELKRREDLAVMSPTEGHVKDYLELWQMAQEKGSVFADTWRRVVWQTPELDYSLRRPTTTATNNTFQQLKSETVDRQLRALAKAHGLIFFFRSDCPYCHQMAPLMKLLSSKYGLEVLGVSIDGKGIAEFPNPVDGRAKASALGIERVPALFIGSKETGDQAPIGFGAMALTDIVNRIFVLTGTKPGDSF
jgi:conjugal transfer pilus assembly protein TraF